MSKNEDIIPISEVLHQQKQKKKFLYRPKIAINTKVYGQTFHHEFFWNIMEHFQNKARFAQLISFPA